MIELEKERVKQEFVGDVTMTELVDLANSLEGNILVALETINKCANFGQEMNAYGRKVFLRHSRLTPFDRKRHIQEMQKEIAFLGYVFFCQRELA